MNIEQFRQKLDGVFDLTNAVDCQSIIRVLLRDLEHSKGETKVAEGQAKILASMVSSDKPTAKDTAKRILDKAEKKSPEEVMDFLLCMCDESKRAETLADEDLVEDAVRAWSEFDMHSRESAVIDELIQRFKAVKGIKDALDQMPEMPKR